MISDDIVIFNSVSLNSCVSQKSSAYVMFLFMYFVRKANPYNGVMFIHPEEYFVSTLVDESCRYFRPNKI